jgi:DNA-directed RNA polymerase specialized sigma24 family protein
MPSKYSIGHGLTWSWAYSTGHPASDQRLDAAVKAAWSYAVLCAWTYLHDQDSAHDLMDFAVHKVAGYAASHPDAPPNKLTGRIKSAVRRRAKQLSARRRHELSYGSLTAFEKTYACQSEAEQRVYVTELFSRLSPFGRAIANGRWLGYSWREIASQFEMDHTAIRRAYFREMEALLKSLSRPGDFPRCD